MQNLSVEDLLLGFVGIYNKQNANLPLGCISKNTETGFYNAKSVLDVANLNDNVIAMDGFIKDGFMVRFNSQRKAEESDKFRGYKATFEVNGEYNGPISFFNRTESEWKIWLNPEIWSSRVRTVTYKLKDEEDKVRKYKEPLIFDRSTGLSIVPDKRASVENRVDCALKAKLRGCEAYNEDGQIFNEKTKRFEDIEQEEQVN